MPRTLSEFFRYHGAWAPGVRLFRRIGFRLKALIIAATFAVPLSVLAWSYYGDKADAIAFSAKERLGVRYARDVMPLLTLLERRRLAAQGGGGADEPQALEGALARLAATEKALGAELGTATAYAAFTAAAARLPNAARGEAAVQAHGAALEALRALLTASTDGSNLTLDPDIDTYYLMDAAMARLPAMIDSAGLLQVQGAAVLGASAAAPMQWRRIAEQAALTAAHLDAVAAGLDKAVAYDEGVKAPLDAEGAKAAVAALLRETDATLLRPEGAAGDAAAHVRAAGEAIGAMAALTARATEQLDRLIELRVARMERSRTITTGVLVASLLAVLYLFVSFRLVLDGGLREVAFHIDAMSAGDLTTQPRPWGADEAAALMNTLKGMQDSLRRIVDQVRAASDHIAHSSSEIAAGAGDLSARTEQSSANLQQSASAMEEISSTVRQSAAIASDATRLAAENALAAERGGRIIGTMIETMQGIHASSTRIGEIVSTIDGIAFQTNILALNAAVEAARAGDAGRGFAVVAAEVRALAQRSAAAAREIKGLIHGSVEQVSQGAHVVREAGSAIEEIVGKTRAVDAVLGQIATGAREQARGVAQTSQAVQALDGATQQNAALVEQTAAAANSLQEQARVLVTEVARFRLPA